LAAGALTRAEIIDSKFGCPVLRIEVRQPHPRQELPMSADTVSPLRQRMIEDMNARKLCPPLPDACIATGLSSHPLLRSAHQPNPRQEYRSCPRVVRSVTHPDRCRQSCQRHGFDKRSARGAKTTRASLPLLRWPHDHHRDLLAPQIRSRNAQGARSKSIPQFFNLKRSSGPLPSNRTGTHDPPKSP
jgi:hypothetical protein